MALGRGTALETTETTSLMLRLRQWLTSKMPSQASLQNNRLLAPFARYLYTPNLWHWNRHSAAGAVAAGLFACWLPFPLHTMLAIALAVLLRGYLPLAIALVWLSNPLTIAPMMYFAYRLGAKLLHKPVLSLHNAMEHDFVNVAFPLLSGALLLALTSALLGWLCTRLSWRWKVQLAWRARHKKRQRKQKQ